MTPTVMTPSELVAELEWIKDHIEADDSFEGSIAWTFGPEPRTFEVTGAVRFGNSMGQGSMRLYGRG